VLNSTSLSKEIGLVHRLGDEAMSDGVGKSRRGARKNRTIGAMFRNLVNLHSEYEQASPR
jgi:hypothetical protein